MIEISMYEAVVVAIGMVSFLLGYGVGAWIVSRLIRREQELVETAALERYDPLGEHGRTDDDRPPEAIRQPLPGCSVIVRDTLDDTRSRRIPCASQDEAAQLLCAIATFARDGVVVTGAYDPQDVSPALRAKLDEYERDGLLEPASCLEEMQYDGDERRLSARVRLPPTSEGNER